jgi:predicted Zn-ribbon and HTH transcriptional regulator
MPQKTKVIRTKVWVCARCGHEWLDRKGQKPLRCAKCKSPYWDTPKRRKHAEGPDR